MPIHLEKASHKQPSGLREMLLQLANGESGFTGTPFGRNEDTLESFLQACIDSEDPAKLKEGYVPQTFFWIVDDTNTVVGMIRMRHHLNAKLLEHGGHIGYYIHPAHRRKGYARAALLLTLEQLRQRGVTRALLTIDQQNVPSNRIAQSCGGRLDGPNAPDDGTQKYWIDLKNPG